MRRSERPASPPSGPPTAPARAPLRIVLFAWCPGATITLDALAAAGAPPRLVVTSKPPPSGAISGACARVGAILERCADVNDPAFVARVATLAPDLLLVAGCAQIFQGALLRTPRLGAVNLHPSLLPEYRGREPLFWAVLRGERRVGITAHRMTSHIDAGPILLQRPITVPDRASSASLARVVDEEAAAVAAEIVAMARSGPLPEGWLPAEPGTHVPPLRPEHGLVDWTRSADEIDRLVRACAGELPAYTFCDGMRLILLEAEVARGPTGSGKAHFPGTILEIDSNNGKDGKDGQAITIATTEGSLAVTRWLFMGRAQSGAELAAGLGLRPGDRFAANPAFRR